MGTKKKIIPTFENFDILHHLIEEDKGSYQHFHNFIFTIENTHLIAHV